MIAKFTEDSIIEQPTIALFTSLGWDAANCFDETYGPDGTLGRETSSEIILLPRLRSVLERLNPTLPPAALSLAVEELSRDRSQVSLVNANCEIYQLLKDGVKVSYRDAAGIETVDTVQVIDWDHPENNDFFLASQFWISGELHKRRPDLIGFVNGLPLVLIELKAPQVDIWHAYDDNLRDYKDTIPQLFWYNAFILLSNGSDTRVGSLTAGWEHFCEWKKINSEGEAGLVSLETAVRGLCDKARLLDIAENFTLFAQAQGGLKKLVARNHQYLGANNAFDSVRSQLGGRQERSEGTTPLGVFWHTQGSGKSYSMIFFAQKVLRKLPGTWTFVVVTDHTDLDDQIYKNFAGVGAVTEPESAVRASSGENLQQLLKEDHRYVFTLIQKFRTERGEIYPKLSDRSDIIVMTDEAHRSQYDVLALNMRNALPKAAFIGFTGTPLMAGEELTRQVFGDYVSIYNFKQSVDDKATVPLYYENRIPELQLTNAQLNDDMYSVIEDADLDEAQETRLEREFSREYHLITRGDRLEKIAEDILLHFLGRGFQGKAMMVSVDKATALRMYNKVQKYWKIHLAELIADYEARAGREFDPQANPFYLPNSEEDAALSEMWKQIKTVQSLDMAVVISQGQNEIDDMRQKGLDIRPHRKRMLEEDLDTRFKDEDDPLRIVFVCAMWMTGFDVPSCSTIYLDKPMRNHTLMQTIARANRVFPQKVNGLIADYIGIFRNLQKALAIYGSASDGDLQPGDMPVETKQALIDQLEEAIQKTRQFLDGLDVDLDAIHAATEETGSFQAVALLDDAVDAVVVNDETKNQYFSLAGDVNRLFHAILPDLAANRFGLDRKAIVVIAEKIRSLTPPADITDVMGQIEELLDDSIAPKGYIIRQPVSGGHYLDLSRINFEALKQRFENGRKHTEAEKLRAAINARLRRMVQLNRTRMDYYLQFHQLIEEYNQGARNIEAFFTELVSFAQNLNQEEQRAISEQLNEEELALFDLLTKPNVKLKRKERQAVKEVARELLDTLKAESLVLDWRKRQQSRAAVQLAIEETLDRLPEAYDKGLYQQKCQVVYQHVYDSYYGEGRSVYSTL